jgi:hypothetical protein
VDQDVWERLRDISKSPGELSNRTKSPEVRKWLDEIASASSRKQHSQEITEFWTFRDAMVNLARGEPFRFSLPGFTYDEVSCWRIFVQMYPESLCLLEQFARPQNSFSTHQRMAALQLLSTLASSGDVSLAGRAQKILKEISSQFSAGHAYEFEHYSMLRQIHYTLAEASGSRQAIDQCIDFIHAHSTEWDLDLNRHYYGKDTDVPFVLSSLRKLEYPKERDLRTKRISEFFLQRVPSKLIDGARRGREP